MPDDFFNGNGNGSTLPVLRQLVAAVPAQATAKCDRARVSLRYSTLGTPVA